MKLRNLLLLLPACALACAPAGPKKPTAQPTADQLPFAFTTHVGPVTTSDGKLCFKLPSRPLKAGTQVVLVLPSEQQATATAKVSGLCPAGDADPAVVDGQPVRRQALELTTGSLPANAIAIGVVGEFEMNVAGDRAFGDLDGDDTAETFRACTSSEGVHLTVWSGPERRWHGYHYLGYDVEPSCTEEETN